MLASKHFNIALGIDIHMVIIPASPSPVPLPHPFVGIVWDPMDYLPFIGAKVHVNKVKRSNAATMIILGSEKHIPFGTGFHPAFMPLIDHEGLQFYGSETVKADGSYFSVAGHNLMTCNCIGIPLGSPNRYLPSTNTVPLMIGYPVMVGGPQVPDLMGVLIKLLMTFGLKFLMKKIKLKKPKGAKKTKSCSC